jgi:protein SCO1
MNPFNDSLRRAGAAVRFACISAIIGVFFFGGFVRAGTTNSVPLPFYNTADFTPEWIEPGSPAYAGIHRIADFCLTNQTGVAVTSGDVAGRIYVANFFFTACPGICLSMTQNLKRVQDSFALDSGVLLLSHSVTPEFDSPAILRRYGEAHGVIPGKWHLVTGTKEGLYDLARNSYFAEVKIGMEGSQLIHSENVLLVDGKRRIRGVYNGTLALEMNRLIEDIRCLQRERN